MQRKPTSTSAVSHSTIALSLRAPESPARRAMGRLSRAAPPPLDHALLLNAVVGASATANAALALLRKPTAEAVHLEDELRVLTSTCIEEYERRKGCVDASDGLEGRLKANSAWALMSNAGSREATGRHPAVEAAGIELLLSMHHQKPMAIAFCNGARGALENDALIGMSLESLMELPEGDERRPHWIKHCRGSFAEFLSIFDGAPPKPLPAKTFEERARTELSCRAAFASYRRRAGILDDTCFSRRQIAEAAAYSASGIFQTPEERKAVMWLVGCSGLYATSTQFIPLAGACIDDWVVAYDVVAGILRRDFSCLAPDAARARPGDNAPATLVALTPAPIDVANTFRSLSEAKPIASELGDLLPALRQITPRDLLYPDLADLAPSLARWSRTLAPMGLQAGLDALLAALVTGDFGVTARSKVHYCLVDSDEQWQGAADLYRAVGWEAPVPMPIGSLPFGASVVPTAEQLAQADKDTCRWVEKVRPPKRMSNEAQLLEFHNRYTRALATRAATWLSLRPASELSLRASIDERFDACIELFEKACAGRIGSLTEPPLRAVQANASSGSEQETRPPVRYRRVTRLAR